MTDLEKEFIDSMKALLVRYDVSLVFVNANQLAFVSKSEDTPADKFIYVSSEDVYRALMLLG